jgi:hypothetical protein
LPDGVGSYALTSAAGSLWLIGDVAGVAALFRFNG